MDQLQKAMQYIDDIATHDAEAIRRMTDRGEMLSTSAAQYGYTPSEAWQLLDHLDRFGFILVDWWKEGAS
jgi:hypothetical protein